MDTIIEITGADRKSLADALGQAECADATVRITLDEGAVKVKIGGGIWSPPLGVLDPMCKTGQVRAAVARSRERAEQYPRETVAKGLGGDVGPDDEAY